MWRIDAPCDYEIGILVVQVNSVGKFFYVHTYSVQESSLVVELSFSYTPSFHNSEITMRISMGDSVLTI